MNNGEDVMVEFEKKVRAEMEKVGIEYEEEGLADESGGEMDVAGAAGTAGEKKWWGNLKRIGVRSIDRIKEDVRWR